MSHRSVGLHAVVDAKSESAGEFYRRLGFVTFYGCAAVAAAADRDTAARVGRLTTRDSAVPA
jgi:hypothetical protein